MKGNKMGWNELSDCSEIILENDIQAVFDFWGKGENGWKIAGTPSWLEVKKGLKNTRNKFIATMVGIDYAFTPDVLWENDEAIMAIELKRSRAEKYEEISLVEILQHSWHIENKYNKRVIPVVISSFSVWMRSALAFLRKKAYDTSTVKYVEATFLKNKDGNSLYMWLEEPLRDWPKTVTGKPYFISGFDNIFWFYDEECSSWIGLNKSERFDRLTTQPLPLLQVAKLSNNNEYLVWVYSDKCKNYYGDYYLFSNDDIGSVDSPDFNKHFE